MLLKSRTFVSSLLFRAGILSVGFCLSLFFLILIIGTSSQVQAQRTTIQQRNYEIENGIKLQDHERRIANIENMKIGETLAELKTSSDYHKALLISILIGVLGVLGERLANMVRREDKSSKP